MANFTKRKLKNPKEIIKGIHKGNFSIIKREFSMKETKETIKLATNTFSELKVKIDELKVVHNRLFHKSLDE